MIHVCIVQFRSLSSHGSISICVSMLRYHTPGRDHRCGVDTDVSACSDLLSGMCVITNTSTRAMCVYSFSIGFIPRMQLQPSSGNDPQTEDPESQNLTSAVSLVSTIAMYVQF